jgi:hypothetical protein
MNHVDLCIATDIVEFKKGVAASDGTWKGLLFDRGRCPPE